MKNLNRTRTEIDFKILFSIFLSFLTACGLILHYRKRSLGDASYYVTNGSQILSQINPYESGFRSGPLGAVFLNLTIGKIPVNFGEVIVLLSGLFGCAIFAYVLFPQHKTLVLLLTPISVVFGSNRELLVNHQINGLILILIAGFWALRGSSIKIGLLAGTFCAAVALDLKPHLTLPILVVLFFAEKNVKGALLTLFWIALSHLVCDLWLGNVTELNWLQNLSNISKDDPWADVANIWPLLGQLPVPDEILKSIAVVFFLALTSILGYLSYLKTNILFVLVALGTPVIGIYCHLYDQGAFLFLALLVNVPREKSPLFYLFFNFAIVFSSFDSPQGMILLVLANSYLFLILKYSRNQYNIGDLRSMSLGLLFYFCYQFVVRELFVGENVTKSLTICVMALLVLCLTHPLLSKGDLHCETTRV